MVCQRADAGVAVSKPDTSVRTSARVKPASCAMRTSAIDSNTLSSYTRLPATRRAVGMSPRLS